MRHCGGTARRGVSGRVVARGKCALIGRMNTIRTVALIGKYKSPEIAEPLLELAAFLEGRGLSVVIDPLTAVHVGGRDATSVP